MPKTGMWPEFGCPGCRNFQDDAFFQTGPLARKPTPGRLQK
jgi:hypothetical protein